MSSPDAQCVGGAMSRSALRVNGVVMKCEHETREINKLCLAFARSADSITTSFLLEQTSFKKVLHSLD